jgi:hypothetical protein
MAAMIFKLPPQFGQCSMSMSNTRFSRRAGARPGCGVHAEDLPRVKGLYGALGYASRALAWAEARGELIAGPLECEPPPLEKDLVDVVDPARFVLKRARAGNLRGTLTGLSSAGAPACTRTEPCG